MAFYNSWVATPIFLMKNQLIRSNIWHTWRKLISFVDKYKKSDRLNTRLLSNILLSETLCIITIYDSRIFQYILLEKIGDLSPHRQRFQSSILEKGPAYWHGASIIRKVFTGSIDLSKWPAVTRFTVHFTVFGRCKSLFFFFSPVVLVYCSRNTFFIHETTAADLYSWKVASDCIGNVRLRLSTSLVKYFVKGNDIA